MKMQMSSGDGTDSTLLEEEQFSSYDACISLTGIDEENVILSMYANKVGIKRRLPKSITVLFFIY